eukprot:Skav212376  [mRNA]  locus=scaffold1983:114840:116285:+ [translate_table: standard]
MAKRSKVLIASWDSLGDGDDISVTVRNLNGNELGQLHSFQSATVGDLEAECLDPQGPLFEHINSPILNFYTTADPEQELPLHVQLRELGPSLIIEQAHVGICLEMWPDTGKFLKAMHHSKFNPRSKTFDIFWTARKAQKVPVREALRLVKDVLSGTASHAESECQFVQVFGRLMSSLDQFDIFNLVRLQNSVLGLRTLKDGVCRYLLDLARTVATSMVNDPPNLPPVFFNRPYGGYGVVGHDFPSQFSRYLVRSLGVNPGFQWKLVASCLLSLEGAEESRECFKNDQQKLNLEEPPEMFQTLHPDEILQMVHVQLRLSCCKVAKVQGSLSEASACQVCVKILAELLRYELKHVKFQDFEGLEQEIQIFDRETEHMDPDRRGSLLLVSDLPSSLKDDVLTSTFGNGARMILCHADA